MPNFFTFPVIAFKPHWPFTDCVLKRLLIQIYLEMVKNVFCFVFVFFKVFKISQNIPCTMSKKFLVGLSYSAEKKLCLIYYSIFIEKNINIIKFIDLIIIKYFWPRLSKKSPSITLPSSSLQIPVSFICWSINVLAVLTLLFSMNWSMNVQPRYLSL